MEPRGLGIPIPVDERLRIFLAATVAAGGSNGSSSRRRRRHRLGRIHQQLDNKSSLLSLGPSLFIVLSSD